MNASLTPLYLGQLQNLHKTIVKDFKSGIAAALKGEGYDFGVLVREANEQAEQRFSKQAARRSPVCA
jgi:hypothetical protein